MALAQPFRFPSHTPLPVPGLLVRALRALLAAGSTSPVPILARSSRVPAAPQQPQRPLHILVVDDEEAPRRALGVVLGARGHRVDTAADGLEALERVDALAAIGGGYDAIFSDLLMPEMSGPELLATLATRGAPAARRIVFTSGENSSALALLDLGGADLIPKPYDPQEVAARLEALIAAGDVRPGIAPE